MTNIRLLAKHEAPASAKAIDDLRTDNDPDDTDRIQATGQPVQFDFTITGLAGKHGRISCDSLTMSIPWNKLPELYKKHNSP